MKRLRGMALAVVIFVAAVLAYGWLVIGWDWFLGLFR